MMQRAVNNVFQSKVVTVPFHRFNSSSVLTPLIHELSIDDKEHLIVVSAPGFKTQTGTKSDRRFVRSLISLLAVALQNKRITIIIEGSNRNPLWSNQLLHDFLKDHHQLVTSQVQWCKCDVCNQQNIPLICVSTIVSNVHVPSSLCACCGKNEHSHTRRITDEQYLCFASSLLRIIFSNTRGRAESCNKSSSKSNSKSDSNMNQVEGKADSSFISQPLLSDVSFPVIPKASHTTSTNSNSTSNSKSILTTSNNASNDTVPVSMSAKNRKKTVRFSQEDIDNNLGEHNTDDIKFPSESKEIEEHYDDCGDNTEP